jgi:hypothetical protein
MCSGARDGGHCYEDVAVAPEEVDREEDVAVAPEEVDGEAKEGLRWVAVRK